MGGLGRVVRVGHGGLGKALLFVAEAVVQGEPLGDAELILDVEADILDGGVDDGVAEALGEALPPLGAGGVAGEVLREGVRLIQDREARLLALDSAIARGLADAEAGRVKPIGAVFDRLESRIKAKTGLGEV